jgi:hypothetical protein
MWCARWPGGRCASALPVRRHRPLRSRGARRAWNWPRAGISAPDTAKISVGTGFTATAYPLLTSVGRVGSEGNLPLWATDSTGILTMIPTTTSTAGVTTVTIAGARTLSAADWGNHQIALDGAYPVYNNSGVEGQPILGEYRPRSG